MQNTQATQQNQETRKAVYEKPRLESAGTWDTVTAFGVIPVSP